MSIEMNIKVSTLSLLYIQILIFIPDTDESELIVSANPLLKYTIHIY